VPVSKAEHKRPALVESFVAPSDETEQVVAKLWGEVLGIDQVGVNDDFFVLGGDSLLAMQLATRLRAELGVDLSAAAVLDAPTVAELTQSLRQLASLAEKDSTAERIQGEL
jgi:acyl carrier protein